MFILWIAEILRIWEKLAMDCLISTSNPETGAWLNALPVPSLGLCLEDETIRIAVGMRLGLDLSRIKQHHT